MLLLAALLVMCATIVYLSPLRQWLNPTSLDTLKLRIAAMGAWGPFIFTLLTTVVVAIGAPRVWMAALGGFAFGWLAGGTLALVGTLGGCWVTFTYARWLGREWVQAKMGQRLAKLNDLLQRHGMVMTLVLRSAPLGNNHVSNLLLALSPIARGPFLLGTALGVLPTTGIYALFGSAATSGSTIGRLTTAALLLVTLSGVYYLLASRSTLVRDTLTVLSNKK
jgi:uncharacterized membrane protein YdjX (TVP38/TMEM64 family)